MSLGEAFFDIPKFSIDESEFQLGFHYSESRGLPALRNLIAEYYETQYNAKINPDEEVIISAGSKALIFIAFQTLLNPGDEVLLPEPAWLSYPELVKLVDGVPKFIPADCPTKDFKNYVTDKTGMIVINNPNNPSGKIYAREGLSELYDFCRSRKINILVDEAYSDFVDGEDFVSGTSIAPDKKGIVAVNSLSKNFGISGWRIGYAVSNSKVISEMLKLNRHIITCAPTILQMYVAKYFRRIKEITLPQAREVVRRRKEIEFYLHSIGLQTLPGSATFYLFVNIADYKYSSLDLAMQLLLKHHIAVVPGSAYGRSTERFIRISAGTETLSDLKRAIDKIKFVIDENEFDSDFIKSELKKMSLPDFRSNTEKKNILVIPGGKWQIPLIKKISENDSTGKIFVVSPEKDSPCFKHSDGYFRSDIFAVEQIESYVEEKNIRAVISDECDIVMPIIAELGKKFKLPALSPESAKLFTNKFLMREFCRKNGFKYPEYRLCRTIDEVKNFFRDLKRPIIIKPLDSNSSHGVFRVENENEIDRHFDETKSFSRTNAAVLAERFIEGTEFTADGVKTPARHYTLAISEKKHFAHNVNIADELFFTHENEKFSYSELTELNNLFVETSGLNCGLTHAEYKFEDGEFYLIEIGARGGGNLISSIITEHMSGHDAQKYLIDYAFGNGYEKDFSINPELKNRAAILKFFSAPNGGGEVKEIRGIEFFENNPNIPAYALNFKVGDVIEDAISDSARIGFFVALAESRRELEDCVKNIEENFSIVVK